jgi:hypothetical protein
MDAARCPRTPGGSQPCLQRVLVPAGIPDGMDPCSFVPDGFQRADSTSNAIMEGENGEAGILLMNV